MRLRNTYNLWVQTHDGIGRSHHITHSTMTGHTLRSEVKDKMHWHHLDSTKQHMVGWMHENESGTRERVGGSGRGTVAPRAAGMELKSRNAEPRPEGGGIPRDPELQSYSPLQPTTNKQTQHKRPVTHYTCTYAVERTTASLKTLYQ